MYKFREYLKWGILIVIFSSLTLRFTLEGEDYDKISGYELPIVIGAFIVYVVLYLTRKKYND